MQQTTEQVTTILMGKLPENVDYLTTGELLNAGFPDFLVKRIRLELDVFVSASLNLHKNEWLDIEDDAVKDAWNRFIEEVDSRVHLPMSYARKVIQKAVADVLLMLVEPRASLAEFIFSNANTLSPKKVVNSSESIPVYRHFGSALPRFMEKKNLTVMSKEQCSHFITALDEKLIARYTSGNWEKVFEPWFVLMGAELNPQLLQQFFNDKNEKQIANSFGRETNPLPLHQILQIIARPENLETTALETTANDKTESAPANNQKKQVRLKENISEETIVGAVKDTQDFEENSIVAKARREYTDQEHTLASENINGGRNEDDNALINRFKGNDEEDTAGDKEEVNPIWKQFISYEPDDDDETETEEKEELEEAEANQSNNLTELNGSAPGNGVEARVEEMKNNTSGINKLYTARTEEAEGSKGSEMNIFQYVTEDKDYYVENLFGGDEDIFNEVLEDLRNCKEWKDAVQFLTEDVFRRNFIDIYSEPAVDFTDALQSYFQNK
ncbi:MAG: hypothetical protein WD491_05090 [Balneolales bacterium]